MKSKIEKRNTRHARIRAKIKGTAERPRLAVFRSNTALYAQLIDDTTGKTLLAVDSRKLKAKSKKDKATEIGKLVAEQANKINISEVVFDRGGFLFMGSIRTLADSAREAGLKF